ncbi:Phenylacetate-CoA oxygenase, PaaI subunit [Caenispirillum salinarum AK4]|uniref:Phenylacetate-CoA oxygenase, PaaI subunit n=1 Tax=Caenispirillum salinarum AK4 TaxID=1238182 RepID=K9GZJ7_9PROT|nr:1,2-phenylacetyl-CoA epoxidase subunit PaaC [Caenispirillum salinarum]EKV30707.1 Phenylacetate-CoA oxygenase, PaaI subunit [Caenispirillum salinarum AK4]
MIDPQASPLPAGTDPAVTLGTIGTTVPGVDAADVVAYALRLGDDSLILGQRLSEWCAKSPEMELDIALMNLSLDLFGRARTLLSHAAALENEGRDEDSIAFLRDIGDFRNVLLVEQPNGDFAETIVRQVLFDCFDLPFQEALAASADETLAAVAAKAVKESAYHLRFSANWLIRLGDGTEESHRRAQAALDALAPYAHELFETDALEDRLIKAGVAVDRAALRPRFDERLAAILKEATLTLPGTEWRPTGGRRGEHSEALGFLLAEMQWMQRAYPDSEW